jgi:type IV pilus assembly protein PilW
MISVAIFAVVAAAAFSVLSASQKTATMNDQTVQIQRNVRLAMDLIARDLRMAAFGNPAAGALAGCAQHLNATDSFTTPATGPGPDAAPDAISIMTVDQPIGTLQAAVAGGTAITVAGLPSDAAAGQVISLDGAFSSTMNAVNVGTGAVTLGTSMGSAAFPAGTVVLRLACVTYSVTGSNGVAPGGATVFPPYTLLRNTTATPNNAVPIVDGIEDLQLAYGIDADSSGIIDDQVGGGVLPNVVDCLDYVPNGTACTQGTTLLGAGTVTTLPSSINATPTSVRQARVTVVGRAVPPQQANTVNNVWKDSDFKSGSAVQAEDHAIAGTTGIRRRSLTRVVTLRNVGTL